MSGEAHLMRQALAGDRPARITFYLVDNAGTIHEYNAPRGGTHELTFKVFSGRAYLTREEAIAGVEAYRAACVADLKAEIAAAQANLTHLEQMVFA